MMVNMHDTVNIGNGARVMEYVDWTCKASKHNHLMYTKLQRSMPIHCIMHTQKLFLLSYYMIHTL